MGSYDPVKHQYLQQPDPDYEANKQRKFERDNGHGSSGIAIRADPVRASFDPILGQCRPPSPAPQQRGQQQRPASAPRAAQTDQQQPAERPATPGRRMRAVQGDSWGTYNPIVHQWHVPPSDARFHDQNTALNHKNGISGTHVRKPDAQPRDQVGH
jgi:hypothetical protein